MGKNSSTNRPVIAGRRLIWDGGIRSVHLRDENGVRLYLVERLYDSQGRALRHPEFEDCFLYQVTALATGEVLGTGPYLGSGKLLAEEHFAEEHDGQLTGFWTSDTLTIELGAQLAG
jgi:hypothetical protein